MGGDIFDFGRAFVAVVEEVKVNDLELQVDVVKMVWSCVNEELCFL